MRELFDEWKATHQENGSCTVFRGVGWGFNDSTSKYFASEVMSFCPLAAHALYFLCHVGCFFLEQGYKLLAYYLGYSYLSSNHLKSKHLKSKHFKSNHGTSNRLTSKIMKRRLI